MRVGVLAVMIVCVGVLVLLAARVGAFVAPGGAVRVGSIVGIGESVEVAMATAVGTDVGGAAHAARAERKRNRERVRSLFMVG